MSSIICPTITAEDSHEYRVQMERIQPFAKRVHIDLMDGEFAPTRSPDLDTVWWPEELVADIHLMYQRPAESLGRLLSLKPQLAVIHCEAEADHREFADRLHEAGIKAGLAVLHDTPIEKTFELLPSFDHVLIFSGHLGYHGGEADLNLLEKVRTVREHFPEIEIGWDGGVNDQNARQLIEAGVDILNVGGFIQDAEDPRGAYEKIRLEYRT